MKTLLSGFRGSFAHGTNTKESDYDTFDIVIMPKEYYIGLKSFESKHTSEDHLIHDIKKFVKLLLKSNPSALEILFTNFTYVDVFILPLIFEKEMFLSKKLVTPVLGHCEQLAEETDGKSLSHLIRLLRMTEETLMLKGFNVFRKDAEYLKEIKAGKISKAEVLKEAEKLINNIRILEKDSSLRLEPDRDKAESLLVNLLTANIKDQLW